MIRVIRTVDAMNRFPTTTIPATMSYVKLSSDTPCGCLSPNGFFRQGRKTVGAGVDDVGWRGPLRSPAGVRGKPTTHGLSKKPTGERHPQGVSLPITVQRER